MYFISKDHLVVLNDDYIDNIDTFTMKNSIGFFDKLLDEFLIKDYKGYPFSNNVDLYEETNGIRLKNFKQSLQHIHFLKETLEAETINSDRYWWDLINNIGLKIIDYINYDKDFINAKFDNQLIDRIKFCLKHGNNLFDALINSKFLENNLGKEGFIIIFNCLNLNAINIFCILYTKLMFSQQSTRFLLTSMKITRESTDNSSTINDPFFYLPLYFTYSPPNVTQRINLQDSVFIYQTIIEESKTSIPQLNKILIQRIKPDYKIKIHKDNKIQILNELNKLNVNFMSIFVDYDNIAKHIKQNFKNQASD